MENIPTKNKGKQVLIKAWTREDGRKFPVGYVIDVDLIKERELIKKGYLTNPNKPKKDK